VKKIKKASNFVLFYSDKKLRIRKTSFALPSTEVSIAKIRVAVDFLVEELGGEPLVVLIVR